MTSLPSLTDFQLARITTYLDKKNFTNLRQTSKYISEELNRNVDEYITNLHNGNIDQDALEFVIKAATGAQLRKIVREVLDLPKDTINDREKIALVIRNISGSNVGIRALIANGAIETLNHLTKQKNTRLGQEAINGAIGEIASSNFRTALVSNGIKTLTI